ncbi:MAG TPA: glycosyltransferase family 4 protein [Microlunatus sp.]|nr:glycosyltransferase family 4 protein [Microlunatus sp.]
MTRPDAVAIVCDYRLDYLGGAQTALLEQARALAGSGRPVLLVAPTDPPAGAELPPGVRLLRVPARAELPGLRLPLLRNTADLRGLLRQRLAGHGVGLVHLHSEFGLAAAAIDVAGELGLPVVHTVHTFFWRAEVPGQRLLAAAVDRFHRRLTGRPTDRPPTPLSARPGEAALRAMTWRTARRSSIVISPSRHQADRLREAGIDRVLELPNTLADPPEPTDPPLPYRPIKIIWLGRCAPEKRLVPFLRAATAAIARLGPGRLRITVGGAGEQLAAARRIAADCPDVTFLGARPHREVPTLLRDHHLLALSSYGFDNQPMSIVEAVLAGRGVLYCDPRLTEGTTTDGRPAAGILADGPDEASWLRLLVGLTEDRVAAACRAAREARTLFLPETFLTKINTGYAGLSGQRLG